MRLQYIVGYPYGQTRFNNAETDNAKLAELLIAGLEAGKSVSIPPTWTVTVVNLQTGQVSSTGTKE